MYGGDDVEDIVSIEINHVASKFPKLRIFKLLR
jgi:hypothetical protein